MEAIRTSSRTVKLMPLNNWFLKLLLPSVHREQFVDVYLIAGLLGVFSLVIVEPLVATIQTYTSLTKQCVTHVKINLFFEHIRCEWFQWSCYSFCGAFGAQVKLLFFFLWICYSHANACNDNSSWFRLTTTVSLWKAKGITIHHVT